MLRITLGGEALNDFPEGQESGYIKLLFPQEGQSNFQAGLKGFISDSKPRMRSYTIRSFSAETQELDIDVATHGEGGPASNWAINAQTGDDISIQGPGAVKLISDTADWFFLAGDMSALPAIAVNLEKLNRDAKGYAVIEVIDADDIVDLLAPEGIEIHWVINPAPSPQKSRLADKVKSLKWLAGEANVWVAGEFNAMREMRKYFKKRREVSKKEIYASSYWKIGTNDEGNKAAKLLDIA